MDNYFDTDRSENAVCEDCGEILSPDATFCPNCGSRRMSKRQITDTELPFQYVTPSIQSQSYSSFEPEEDFSLDFVARDYDTDDYDTGNLVAEDFGVDYSDFMETMRSSPVPDRRIPTKRTRREEESEDQYEELECTESSKPAISVLIAACFLGAVLFVSLMGFIVSLFAGSGSVETVPEDNPPASSASSSVSSSAEPTSSSSENKVVHLLPEEVTNDSYEKFRVDDNTFTTVMASSYISAKLTHGSTELAFDGDPQTSWQDGVKGYGEGEWLLAYNSDGSAVKVSEVTVYNGYQNPKFNTAKKDMYLVNSRVSGFTLTFDDGTSESFTLEDIKEPQTFKFKARKTCCIKFTIDGAYKGTKYKDTCIGEIIYK